MNTVVQHAECQSNLSLPSRRANPFATCWTRPGQLVWRNTDEADLDIIVRRLDTLRIGQIVGPHGAGKSTLLAALHSALQQRGDVVLRWTLDGSHHTEPCPGIEPHVVLIVDGYEQLSRFSQPLLRWRCWRRNVRLVVTAHAPVRLPVLAELRPTLQDALPLFERLTAQRSSPVTREMAAESYHRCNGNLRDMWFDLYDQHERLVNSPRTISRSAT